jgi:hypothetical protein
LVEAWVVCWVLIRVGPAEIEKEKQAQAMDAAFKASTQGTAAAQQGNIAAVTRQINAYNKLWQLLQTCLLKECTVSKFNN